MKKYVLAAALVVALTGSQASAFGCKRKKQQAVCCEAVPSGYGAGGYGQYPAGYGQYPGGFGQASGYGQSMGYGQPWGGTGYGQGGVYPGIGGGSTGGGLLGGGMMGGGLFR